MTISYELESFMDLPKYQHFAAFGDILMWSKQLCCSACNLFSNKCHFLSLIIISSSHGELILEMFLFFLNNIFWFKDFSLPTVYDVRIDSMHPWTLKRNGGFPPLWNYWCFLLYCDIHPSITKVHFRQVVSYAEIALKMLIFQAGAANVYAQP